MKNKKYTAYSLITTILEEIALAMVVLWLLPEIDIHVPLCGLVLMMLALAVVGYITYRFGKQALDKEVVVSPEVGGRGIAVTPLAPHGYVRVDGELWQATSTSLPIDKGAEVVIARKKGLTLFVTPVDDSGNQAHKVDTVFG